MSKTIYEKLYSIKCAKIKLVRDTEGYKYQYATLNQLQEKLQEVFTKEWLFIIHRIEDWNVITRIQCKDDKDTFIESAIPLSQNVWPQDKWSEITYYRRYNLIALLDLETEDDDWEKAQESTWKKAYKGKFDLMDYIQRIKDEDDLNHLEIIYKEFMEEKPSEKQKECFVKEAGIRKDYLLDNQ